VEVGKTAGGNRQQVTAVDGQKKLSCKSNQKGSKKEVKCGKDSWPFWY
jgi:hypothetical protein